MGIAATVVVSINWLRYVFGFSSLCAVFFWQNTYYYTGFGAGLIGVADDCGVYFVSGADQNEWHYNEQQFLKRLKALKFGWRNGLTIFFFIAESKRASTSLAVAFSALTALLRFGLLVAYQFYTDRPRLWFHRRRRYFNRAYLCALDWI